MAVKFYGVLPDLSDTSQFSELDASGISAETRINTLGYGAPGDNGGGQYRILDTSDTPDNFLVFGTATAGKQAHLLLDEAGRYNAFQAGVSYAGTRADNTARIAVAIAAMPSDAELWFGEERKVIPVEDDSSILLDKNLRMTGHAILQGDPARTKEQKDVDTLFDLHSDLEVTDLRFEKLGIVFDGDNMSIVGSSKPNARLSFDFCEFDDLNFPVMMHSRNADYPGDAFETIDLWRVFRCKVTNCVGGFQARAKKFLDIDISENLIDGLTSFFSSSEPGMVDNHGRGIRIGRDHPSQPVVDEAMKKVRSCRIHKNVIKDMTINNPTAGYAVIVYVDNVHVSGNIVDGMWQETAVETAWDSGTAYTTGDAVAHDGRYWRAAADNTNSEPTQENTDWVYNITDPVSAFYFRGPKYLCEANYLYDCSTGWGANGMIHVKSNAQGGIIRDNWLQARLAYWQQIGDITGSPTGPIGVELEKSGQVLNNRFLDLEWPVNLGATGTPLMVGNEISGNVFDLSIDSFASGVAPENRIRLRNDSNSFVTISNNRVPRGGIIDIGIDTSVVDIINNKFATTTEDSSRSSFLIASPSLGNNRIKVRGNEFNLESDRGSTHFIIDLVNGGDTVEIVENDFRFGSLDTGRFILVTNRNRLSFHGNSVEFYSSNFRFEIENNVITKIYDNEWIYRGSSDGFATKGLLQIEDAPEGSEIYIRENAFEITTATGYMNFYVLNSGLFDIFELSNNRTRGEPIDRVARMNGGTITDFRFEGNYLPGAGWALFNNGVTITNPIIRDNQNTFTTEKRDKATITNGTASVQVAHGLDNRGVITWLPEHFRVTYLDALGNAKEIRVSAADNTNVTFATDVDPGADVQFAWEAKYSL